jgi:hypothetical protein
LGLIEIHPSIFLASVGTNSSTNLNRVLLNTLDLFFAVATSFDYGFDSPVP